MSRNMDNPTVRTETPVVSPAQLADEVFGLRHDSPISAADVFLKQVANHKGKERAAFVEAFETELNQKYGKAVLPQLILDCEKIGGPGHASSSEVRLAAETHRTIEHLARQNNLPTGDANVNGVGVDRNAINANSDQAAKDSSLRWAMPPEVSLTPADLDRAGKISGDLRRGDFNAMRGASFQLEGMIKDEPARAIAVIADALANSHGAPAYITYTPDGKVYVVNPINPPGQKEYYAGRLGHGYGW